MQVQDFIEPKPAPEKKKSAGRNKGKVTAQKVYDAITGENGHLSLAKIAPLTGVTRQRMHQIILDNGWKALHKRPAPRFPIEATAVCGECGKQFSYMKEHNSHVKKRCSTECVYPLKFAGKACYTCREKAGGNVTLLRSGFSHGDQRWVCRQCCKEKERKYGRYTPKTKAGVEALLKRGREYSFRYYHTYRCKCHASERGAPKKSVPTTRDGVRG